MAKPFELDELWLKRITESLDGISFGIVQIVVHDGQIVQIERTERQRFDLEPARTLPKPVGNHRQKRTKP